MARIPTTDIDVFPLCLGSNVFGWTADRETSFAILDAFAEGGGDFIDTADVYSSFVEGNVGGESETIIGDWMAGRGNRDQIVIATKTGLQAPYKGLSRSAIRGGVEECLRRLRTDVIDLFYAHWDDPDTPLDETVDALNELVTEGKAKAIGVCNYSAARLTELMGQQGAERISVLQTHYNLVERGRFEGDLAAVADANGLGILPYYGLAQGFLTGKYRNRPDDPTGVRHARIQKYLDDDRSLGVVEAVVAVADRHGIEPATVALAWLRSRPGVLAPIASASRPDQLPALLASAAVELTTDDLAELDAASS
jgi:aryl-alcohol dehydrogenase-like predicted oxidoreductase